MKTIILDRDGVINEDSDDFIKSVDEWRPLPGSLESIARLNHAGYHVAIASNQSGIARGLLDVLTLNEMHQKMHRMLAKLGGHVDIICFCPHGPEEGCDCRKPKPGLYQEIAHRWGVDLIGMPIIGDSRRDLEAAVSVRAQPVLVRTGKGDRTLSNLSGLGEVPIYDNLVQAVDALLAGAL